MVIPFREKLYPALPRTNLRTSDMNTSGAARRARRKLGSILIAFSDPVLRHLTQVQLDKMGYETWTAANTSAGLDILRQETVELVFCDLHVPGASGLDLLKEGRALYPKVKFVVVGTTNTAVEAMKSGAYDFLTKPVHSDDVRALVERLFGQHKSTDKLQVLSHSADPRGFESLLGESKSLKSAIDLASRAAQTDACVLITGETGTGKELLARAIHSNGERHDWPFITVNCGSIPRDLVESELFGHVKGAFTGAFSHQRGRAEMADGGTLFLDEIGEMPPEMQIRLLRLVQGGEIHKVGAPSAVQVDARIIAATHRNLEELIRAGLFREDLYYRLAIIPINLPPLRDRRDDIPQLVQAFFEESKEVYHRPDLRLPASLIPYMCKYDWPGNVRQLRNCIVRLVVLAAGREVTFSDLPDFLKELRFPQSWAMSAHPPQLEAPSEFRTEDKTLDEVDRLVIRHALEKFDWNQTRTAQYLGVSRKVLRGRAERYGIKKPA